MDKLCALFKNLGFFLSVLLSIYAMGCRMVSYIGMGINQENVFCFSLSFVVCLVSGPALAFPVT